MNEFTLWILLPVFGALFGWVGSSFAITLLFHPVRPKSVLGMTFQGLIPRQKNALINYLSEKVGAEALASIDVEAFLQKPDVQADLKKFMEDQIDLFIDKQTNLNPLVKGFLQGGFAAQIKSSLVGQVQSVLPSFLEALLRKGADAFQINELLRRKFEAMNLEDLESSFLKRNRRDLLQLKYAITIWGAIGGLIQSLLICYVSNSAH